MIIRRKTKRGAHGERRVAKARGHRQTGRMTRALNHPSSGKRAELALMVELLTPGFDEPQGLIP